MSRLGNAFRAPTSSALVPHVGETCWRNVRLLDVLSSSLGYQQQPFCWKFRCCCCLHIVVVVVVVVIAAAVFTSAFAVTAAAAAFFRPFFFGLVDAGSLLGTCLMCSLRKRFFVTNFNG